MLTRSKVGAISRGAIFCVLTYIYSLLMVKDLCEFETYQVSFRVIFCFICVIHLEISSFFFFLSVRESYFDSNISFIQIFKN
jgi:hypothetical protein